MSHKRTAIRDAVITTLSGKTSAATRVFASRVLPMWKTAYPAILVYSREESSRAISRAPSAMVRSLNVAIQILVKGMADLDKAMDDIAREVEDEMNKNSSLGGLAQNLNLISTELDAMDSGEEVLGAARLTYEVVYEE